MLYTENNIDLASYIYRIHQPIFIIFWQEIVMELELSQAYLIYHVCLLVRP